jgi:uncharacterized delta-60 repeat protein
MKNLILLIVICTFTLEIAFAQVTTVWVRLYNGPGNDYDNSSSVVIDNSGNIYVAGSSTGSGSGLDYIVLKYSAIGSSIWTARYNSPWNGDDNAYLVKTDNSGNLYVSGSSGGPGSSLDYCVVKYNSSGIFQWAARYNGPGNAVDEVYSMQIDNSGNVYITGYSNGGTSGDDICTIKYNPAGLLQWVKRFNGNANGDDYGNSLQLDNQSNVYVTCAVTRSGTDIDYLTIKYSSDGNEIWTAYYDGPVNGEDYPSSNAIDNIGNIYVTGYSEGIGTERDYCTIKYNINGQPVWESRYDGPDGWDESFNVVLDNQGNVYVTGNSAGVGTGDDYCTIKYNNLGDEEWVARYSGPGASNDYCNWVAVDPTGNVYVTGIVGDGIGNPQNMVTVGYNPNGVQQWVQSYNGTGDEFDSGNALAVDNIGNVYVTGGSDNLNNTDIITIKYSSTIGIHPISSETPQRFSLSQNFPNPFNPSTTISFSIPKSNQSSGVDTKLIIYDATGKDIVTLVNENLFPGIYEISFDGSKLSSGVYFSRLTAGKFSGMGKMILTK